MLPLNDNVASRERAGQGQADGAETAAVIPHGPERDASKEPSFYPDATSEFLCSDTLYEGGVSAEPPTPEQR